MIINILTIISALAIFVYVVLPLTGRGKQGADAEESQKRKTLDDLLWQRQHLMTTITELDFEYKLGKLSEPDYDEIKQDYQSQLRQLDGQAEDLLKQKGWIAALEQEILSHRETKKKK